MLLIREKPHQPAALMLNAQARIDRWDVAVSGIAK
jgi:hypothetical protein